MAEPRPSRDDLLHAVEAEALRDYLRCPQEYAYRWIYEAPEPPRTTRQLFDRCLRRTALTIAREVYAGGNITRDRSLLLWQLHIDKTEIQTLPKLDLLGREAIGRFFVWLRGATVPGLAITRQVVFEYARKQQCSVRLTADFVLTRNGRTVLVLLTPPHAGILPHLLACDDQPWLVYDLPLGKGHELTELPSAMRKEVGALVTQGYRGIGHKLVWPHRDQRCRTCPYADICTPGDARSYLLRTASKRKRVLDRIAEQRALRGS